MEPASHPVALGNKEQALVTNSEHRKGLSCKEAMLSPLSKDTPSLLGPGHLWPQPPLFSLLTLTPAQIQVIVRTAQSA